MKKIVPPFARLAATCRRAGLINRLAAVLILSNLTYISAAAKQETEQPAVADNKATAAVPGQATSATETELQQRAAKALEDGDVATALAIYQRQAYAGEAWAQIILGQINHNGRLVKASIANAVDWYARAAMKGVPEAQYRLGMLFCDEQDENTLRPGKCVDWLQRAAGNKHPAALYQLALLAYQGRYITGELDRTKKMAIQALDAGIDEAGALISRIDTDLKSFAQKVRTLDAEILNTRYNPRKSTVRLAAFKNKSQLQRFALKSPLDKLYAYQVGNAWVLSHGSFLSQELATEAIAEMDENMRKLDPTALRWSEVLANLQSSQNPN